MLGVGEDPRLDAVVAVCEAVLASERESAPLVKEAFFSIFQFLQNFRDCISIL